MILEGIQGCTTLLIEKNRDFHTFVKLASYSSETFLYSFELSFQHTHTHVPSRISYALSNGLLGLA
jgi:hypothetical protein